ncbi:MULTISPECIES: YbhB/YbcL family Raf kinase inhibitor-like protein [Methanoculleus]|jgi:Raf kinase inhibitor-like YbhB/YbcL family protein|uniref:Phospholipid-binding protein, PBP family n=1 Tax=Methanoculleus thermophilus TaxID=2200 RepID=A0A1G9BI10_9EURY|nr:MULTISPECIES: YbhB/YbcL family Raf kinase inhibitor-like protein [Methanoculleus]NLN08922.1 YbhB/YbcL family Raf kinase inhibitor-like protein [Methanoculleus thermophilus]SDK39141.1 phospholipid-binding protein, PBP family [Methanoculleus thermophilus]HQD25286.1 YbhB/YbcL family Raf kinase inhibitor-like protein [Methanoculleus thermophilus]
MTSRVATLVVSLRSAEFPIWNTCDGADLSPELRIRGLTDEMHSIAVFALNPFEPGCSFTTWIIWNLSPSPLIPEGIPKQGVVTTPVNAVQGTNDYGSVGWRGPCPPRGETHRYLFKVYGLDDMLDLAPGANKHDLIDAMRGHVLGFGETAAMYSR